MPLYKVSCDSCGEEYGISMSADDNPPNTCSFCGSEIDESNIMIEETEEDWKRMEAEGGEEQPE